MSARESLLAFSLEPRLLPSRWASRASPLLAMVVTATIAGAMFALLGASPLTGIQALLLSPINSASGISEVLLKASPLCLTAIGLSIAFKTSVNNIGAEGQVILGGIGATAVALHVPDSMSAWLAISLALLAGAAAGGLWAALPAWLRTRFGVNETLTTLLLVYVAVQLLSWLTTGPWRDPQGLNFPETRLFNANMTLPKLSDMGWSIWDGTRLNISAFFAVAAAVITQIFMTRSPMGFRLVVSGLAPRAAAYAGFSASTSIWAALSISGALSGFAGAVEVCGTLGQLQAGWVPGYGFTAIVAAYLGRLSAGLIVLSALLLALIDIGSTNVQMALGLPSAVSALLQGVLLLSILGLDLLVRYRIRRIA
ncbi:ABC transporter permease [Zoogloea sp. LCSB751]|uniref:ABC transporter permease n=1 Tax=Zoogloea sp. LCSB751 TaxID=1965277 RepID=UPI0009A47B1D|nr:ABC transporter permease [Zoogloea sp. LCSB751]